MSQWCSFKIKSLWSSVGLCLSGSVNSPSYGKSGLSAILLSLSFAVIIFSRCFRLHASESALNIASEACVLIHAAVLHHCSHLTDGAAGQTSHTDSDCPSNEGRRGRCAEIWQTHGGDPRPSSSTLSGAVMRSRTEMSEMIRGNYCSYFMSSAHRGAVGSQMWKQGVCH